MKKHADVLFLLIRSLSKTEKRYFKVSVGQQSSEKNYMKLFDALDKLSDYDEQKLLKKLKGETFVKSLHVTKKYLYDLILSTLRDFHTKNDIEGELAGLLFNARILENKGLYVPCRKLLNSVIKKAELFDFKTVQIDGLKLKIKLSIMLTLKKRKEEVKKLYEELDKVVIGFATEQKLKKVNDMVFMLVRQRGNLKKEEEREYLDNSIKPIMEIEEPKDFWGRLSYLSTFGHYHKFVNEYKECYAYRKKIIDLWDTNPHMIQVYMTQYLICFNNFLSGIHLIGNYQLMKENLEKIESTAATSIDGNGEKFWMECMYWMLYALNASDYEKGAKIIKRIETHGDKFKAKLIKSRELILYSNIRYLYFHKKEYNKALEWNNKILKDPKVEIAENIRRTSLIFQLPIYCSLDDFDELENKIKSVKKNLRRNGELNEVERRIIKLFENLVSAVPGTQQKYKQEFDDWITENSKFKDSLLVSLKKWL